MRVRRRRITYVDVFLWGFRIAVVFIVVVGSIATLKEGRYTGRQWGDFVEFGLAQGGIYALIALGYTMVYGVLNMINFAHGEVFMSGAYIAYYVAVPLGASGFINRYVLISLLLLTAVAIAVSTSVALLVERIAYRPLRRAPRMIPLITAIGASFFLQYTFRSLFGAGVQAYPDIGALTGEWQIGPVHILRTQAIVLVAAVVAMLVLYVVVMRTKFGKAMRAVSEDRDAAALMGIDVDRVIVFTFALGGAMAGVGGILYALVFKQVYFFSGFVPGIKAFTAAVLGGIGNIPGAMLGGFFLGVVESLGPALFLDGLGVRAPYQLRDVIAFTMLLIMLIFRPSGFLGERLATKRA
ncbi:MAG TPA: branched-chain amino acid ABC transporter permease [bacterium]|nr:branched-chain amino acid ABC transporter permease [bacterium]